MGNAFGSIRKKTNDQWKNVENMWYLNDNERADLTERAAQMSTTRDLIRYAKNNVTNGTQLISPLLSEGDTESYILFIRDYLFGNIEQANARYRNNPYSIALCAHYMASVRSCFDGGTLWRGINLEEAPTTELLPYNSQHAIYSYTDDKTVACGFAAMGRGVPVLLRARPNPMRVLFHYAYFIAFPELFTTTVGIYDVFADGPIISPGFSKADISHLMPQREVLLVNSSKFKQQIISTKENCSAKTRYKMMGEDSVKRYTKALDRAKELQDPFNPYPNETYKFIQEKARRESIRDLDPDHPAAQYRDVEY